MEPEKERQARCLHPVRWRPLAAPAPCRTPFSVFAGSVIGLVIGSGGRSVAWTPTRYRHLPAVHPPEPAKEEDTQPGTHPRALFLWTRCLWGLVSSLGEECPPHRSPPESVRGSLDGPRLFSRDKPGLFQKGARCREPQNSGQPSGPQHSRGQMCEPDVTRQRGPGPGCARLAVTPAPPALRLPSQHGGG